MSKARAFIYFLLVMLYPAALAQGQDLLVTIDLRLDKPPIVGVEGRHNLGRNDVRRRNLSFLSSVAGIGGIARRISDLRLLDVSGHEVPYKKLADGEYLSDADFESWAYKIDLTPPAERSAAAHVSWFAGGRGILMLADVLPQFQAGSTATTAVLTLRVDNAPGISPSSVSTTEKRRSECFDIADVENAVFYLGSWVGADLPGRDSHVDLISSGTWNFTRDDAASMANQVYESYLRLFGSEIGGKPIIAISKFPGQVGFGSWEAETRGRSITIISSDMPFRTQSIQRLHEQLRHELFHLWIPNDVNLTGSYDWFYEGFALYQSLRLGVAANRIRFADFLDTLSRAHTIDSAHAARKSLTAASRSRFTGSSTQIYARGMLVAFMTDIVLLEGSKGKKSVEDLLRDLYVRHRRPAPPVDGHRAVIELLTANKGVETIVSRYVTGTETIDWTKELAMAGMEDGDPGPVTMLRVKEKLNGRQKTLLDKLGYNNWRKLSPNSR